MIVVLISYIGLDRPGYYFSLLYTSLALAFFLVSSLLDFCVKVFVVIISSIDLQRIKSYYNVLLLLMCQH